MPNAGDEHGQLRPRLIDVAVPSHPDGAVIVLHGGASRRDRIAREPGAAVGDPDDPDRPPDRQSGRRPARRVPAPQFAPRLGHEPHARARRAVGNPSCGIGWAGRCRSAWSATRSGAAPPYSPPAGPKWSAPSRWRRGSSPRTPQGSGGQADPDRPRLPRSSRRSASLGRAGRADADFPTSATS